MTGDRGKFMVKCSLILLSVVFLMATSGNNAVYEEPGKKAGKKSGAVINKESGIKAGEKAGVNAKKEFCDAVNSKFIKFRWYKIICNPKRWEIFNFSSGGNPILYQEFGFNDPNNKGPVNLVFCGVHGNETPGVYICFYLIRDIIFDNPGALKNFRLVMAPIVNPDGFFANTRVNGNGVDPNRNLPTEDWDRSAEKVWMSYNKNPLRYPGARGGSEAESRLQTYLIDKYKPDKIISVHTPLGMLDYDGPGDQKYYDLIRVEKRAKFLGLNIEANSGKFIRLVDYRFFPGSLGNYAGNERKIPTYTVELPTSNQFKSHYYWSVLRFALIRALNFEVYDGKEMNPFFKVKYMPHEAVDTETGQEESVKSKTQAEKISRETVIVTPQKEI
jgi:protein MpaA